MSNGSWWDEFISSAGDAIGDAIDTGLDWIDEQVVQPVNDVIDTYIYDSTDDVAWLEARVNEAAGWAEENVWTPLDGIFDVRDNAWNTYVQWTEGNRDMVEYDIQNLLGLSEDMTNQDIENIIANNEDYYEEQLDMIDDVIDDIIVQVQAGETSGGTARNIASNSPIGFAFEPLSLILNALVDNIGARLEEFIANAFGVKRE